MGAVGKANLTFNFDFNIPAAATITGATAFIKAGETSGQNIGVQLASNASVDPPTTIGNQRSLPVTGVGSGNCAATVVTSLGTTLADWGVGSLAPAIVNSAQFGLVFTKIEISSIKVDAICLKITYQTDDGPAAQQECFREAPPPEFNTIRIVKDVVGTPPDSDWAFNGSGDIGGNFTIDAEGGFHDAEDLDDATYTITETPKDGYTVTSECFIEDVSVATGDEEISVTVEGGESASCVFTNTLDTVSDPAARATFRVTKDFTDDNPSEVLVAIDCTTGLILDQSKLITETKHVVFVVTDFDAGELNCDISEVIPEGYSPTYDASILEGEADEPTDDALGCHFENVVGGEFQCAIVNTPDPVDVVIEKVWIIEGSGGGGVDTSYELKLFCDAEIVGGYHCGSGTWCEFHSGDDSDVFTSQVIPEYENSQCWVEETVFDSSVEIDNGCRNLVVSAGQGDSCVITNTVFFEGIPTLDQYGKALLVLLMLGMGIVGFRRFG